jgi:GNAT superfamily N-acetyltransferase
VVAIRETIDMPDGNAPGPSLDAFLEAFLGAWPATPGLHIVGFEGRRQPGWDGSIQRVIGVVSPSQSVISVPPDLADAVRAGVPSRADIASRLPAAVGRPAARTFFGKFRWTTEPTDLVDAGIWVPATDPRVPEWLHPFGGDVLIAFIDGVYAAGVGIKRHNPAGLELSVGTEEAHRGRGLASRLVAQAARWVLAQGAVPIYLHDPANTASDRTALAAGFPDLGWQILGVSGGE